MIEFLKYCVVGGIAFIADTASLMLFYHFVFGEFSFDLLFLHIADGRTAAATAVGFLVGWSSTTSCRSCSCSTVPASRKRERAWARS